MTKPTVGFLNPRRKLVDEVVDWLCHESRVRTTPEGAQSLAHLMVVVPTAQSGRNLRLALARLFEGKGVLPPRIVSPKKLVVPAATGFREATATELAAVFQHYVGGMKKSVLSADGTRVVALRHLFTPDAFTDMTARFALLDQLNDIWRILAGGGLTIRDVLDEERCPEAAKFLEENSLGDEIERWRELAELEAGFFDELHARGICHPVENVRAACETPAPISEDVEEVVLPALADPIRVLPKVLAGQRDSLKITVLLHAERGDAAKFDEWGRPIREAWTGGNRPTLAALKNRHIVCTSTETALAGTVAADFPDVSTEIERPAVALCDENLFPELSAAFLNRGYELHNPERHRLARSSLGSLVRALTELYRVRTEGLPWKEFAAVMRSDDILKALGLDDHARAQVAEGMDVAQNNFLPDFLPPNAEFPSGEVNPAWKAGQVEKFCECARRLLEQLAEARKAGSSVGFVRTMLEWTFKTRRLFVDGGGREFRAACDEMRELLNRLDSEVVKNLGLCESDAEALFLRELKTAEYSLEPDMRNSLMTEGWLELAWSEADHLCLAGFHEGSVPDSVIGHPFLPDALRGKLGLTTNDDRLARDTWLIAELFDSHPADSIRVYVARTDDAGDIKRPSRLLYLCADDELPQRTRHLFGNLVESVGDRSRRVAPGWELQLPAAVPMPEKLSPSRIDTYIKCPFTYLLKYGVGMERVKEKKELEANDFGSLVHLALEEYAKLMMARGDNQLTDADDIRAVFAERIFPMLHRRHAGSKSLGLKLQLEALEGRLGLFAEVQSEWAKQGWRICAAEFKVNARPFAYDGIDVTIRGTVDRIDRNLDTGKYRVIDYKTWDDAAKANDKVYLNVSKCEAQRLLAERLGLPIIANTTTKDGKPKQDAKRFGSIQLPLYAKCLEAMDPAFVGNIEELCYLVLGKDLGCTKACTCELMEHREVALDTVRQAIRDIGANLFWPPGPTEEWKWGFEELFAGTPEKDLAGSDWVKAQNEKVAVRAEEARR